MTAIQEYKSKHKDVSARLRTICISKSKEVGRLAACEVIAPKLGVSSQTVYNYTCGRIKDGYLAEAIINEFELL